MINAELHGKSHVPEDRLTSSCLGLLNLFDSRYLIEFLREARDLNQKELNLNIDTQLSGFYFWPWLPGGGEPDVLLELQNPDSTKTVIVIEAKHGAGKSGSIKDSEIGSPDACCQDQLARYWRAAGKTYPKYNVEIIYLTHHRYFPENELRDTLTAMGEGGKVFWLSWFSLYRFALRVLPSTHGTESRVRHALINYLDASGYACFSTNFSLSCRPQLRPSYTRKYTVNGSIESRGSSFEPLASCSEKSVGAGMLSQTSVLNYLKKYNFEIRGERLQCFYKKTDV